MDKVILTVKVNEERYAYKHEVSIGDEVIHVREAIPRREKEEMA